MPAFQKSTKEPKMACPAEVTEVVAHTIASALDSNVQLAQHEQLAHNVGFAITWIKGSRRI
jgi:hypothetical protein